MLEKYPKTFHLPWSPGKTKDDRTLFDLENFKNKIVVMTEKMDGENTSMTREKIWHRSLDSFSGHFSRHYVNRIHGIIKSLIPENIRICGENLHYQKSIKYDNLKDFFLVFSIWENNICLSLDDTKRLCSYFGLTFVPIFKIFLWDEEEILHVQNDLNFEKTEGYVIRLFDSFKFEDFNKSVVKYVRKHHVQTDEHWMNNKNLKKNLLEKI